MTIFNVHESIAHEYGHSFIEYDPNETTQVVFNFPKHRCGLIFNPDSFDYNIGGRRNLPTAGKVYYDGKRHQVYGEYFIDSTCPIREAPTIGLELTRYKFINHTYDGDQFAWYLYPGESLLVGTDYDIDESAVCRIQGERYFRFATPFRPSLRYLDVQSSLVVDSRIKKNAAMILLMNTSSNLRRFLPGDALLALPGHYRRKRR